jgi:membrane fusion protein
VNAQTQSLFRREALDHRRDRLHGEVSIAVPISWQLIGYAFLAALVAAAFFLATASYARVETVGGAIVLDRGVAAILPTRTGIVDALPVSDGQRVAAGAVLARIRAEEDAARGETAPKRVVDALEQQDARLSSQSSLVLAAAGEERRRLGEQIHGLAAEIGTIDKQMEVQRRMVEVAANEFREVQGIAGKGYISRRDLEARETALLARRQQLSQLEQVRAAKVSSLAEARRAIAQSGVAAAAQAASVQSSRAEVGQRLAQAEAARGYVLASPIAGTVTALTARLGQPASTQQPLMTIVPDGAAARAELYVPTSAAGFLAVGQDVRLAIDAFPYDRFGSVEARITQISSVAIPKVGKDGAAVPVYLVTAEIKKPWVMAFGRRQPLLGGMTLSARIVTERQSLFHWLFQPLFAVRNR